MHEICNECQKNLQKYRLTIRFFFKSYFLVKIRKCECNRTISKN